MPNNKNIKTRVKMNTINWDMVKFDLYKMLNNLNQVVDMDIDMEVEIFIKILKEHYNVV